MISKKSLFFTHFALLILLAGCGIHPPTPDSTMNASAHTAEAFSTELTDNRTSVPETTEEQTPELDSTTMINSTEQLTESTGHIADVWPPPQSRPNDNKQEVAATTTAEPTISAASSVGKSSLHVSGRHLVDNSGNIVQLRGVSTSGLSWFPAYVNEQAFADLRSWGVNTIRLAMYTAEYNGYCVSSDSQRQYLKNLVDTGVQAATKNNMYVIIDWHTLTDSNPNTYLEQSKAFFAEMAQKYANYSNVIYEICNEPGPNTSWAEVKSYAEAVIPVIRQYDAKAVIIVGTPTWSQDVDIAANDPITIDNNVLYSLHFYAGTHKAAYQNKMITAINKNLPIIVSEYGICDASGNGAVDTASADTWMNLLNQYQIGSVIWNLSNKTESSALIQSGSPKTSGWTDSDLSAGGQWFKNMMAGSSGGSVVAPPPTTPETPAPTQPQPETPAPTPAQPEPSQPETTVPTTPAPTTPNVVPADGLTLTLANSWEEGGTQVYHYLLSVRNTSSAPLSSWTIQLSFSHDVTINSSWNGTFDCSGKTITITPMPYNAEIAAGQEASNIGLIVKGPIGFSLTAQSVQ